MKNIIITIALLIGFCSFGQDTYRFGNATADKTLSEVLSQGADASGTTITNLGAPSSANDAARKTDVDAISVPLSSINKNTNYTLTTSDENRIVAGNPAVGDSIVYDASGPFSGPGFIKIFNKGDGFVAVEGALNGDYKTAAGAGETISLRIEHADSVYVQQPSLLTSYTPIVPSVNFYTSADAANPDETNAVGDWINNNNVSISSSAAEQQDGSYSIFIEATDNVAIYAEAEITITGLTASTSYTFSFYSLMDSATGDYRLRANDISGTPSVTIPQATSTWTQFNLSFTASDTTHEFRLQMNDGVANTIGEGVYIDNITITED